MGKNKFPESFQCQSQKLEIATGVFFVEHSKRTQMKKMVIGVMVMLMFQFCTNELSEIDELVGSHIEVGDMVGYPDSNIPSDAFLGQYFSTQEGNALVYSKVERRIRHDFNSPVREDIATKELGAKWSGYFEFEPGTYTFNVSSDKRILLTIDGEVVLNKNGKTKDEQAVKDLDGIHKVEVEYNLVENTTDTIGTTEPDTSNGGSPDTGSSTGGSDTGSSTGGSDTGSSTGGTDTGSSTGGTDTGSSTGGTDTGSSTGGSDTGSSTGGTTDGDVVNTSSATPTVEVVWEETQNSATVSGESGIFYTAEELALWRERAQNGPYRTKGDFVTNSPGEWDRLIKFTNEFKGNPGKDLWDGSIASGEPHDKHLDLLSAAFVSLVNEDESLALIVKNQLIKQANAVDPKSLNYIDAEKGFHTANWFLRILYAFDFTKKHFSQSEKEILNSWFSDAAYVFAENTNAELTKVLPNRWNGDYTLTSGVAKTGGFTEGQYAFINENGQPVNQVYWVHKKYNNRRASKVRLAGMVGIFLNNQELIKHGKLFVKELLMFGTFPDGTMAEYERNGEYGSPQTGAMYYGAINIEVAMNLADALARKGDNELYEFTTSEGIYSTVGGQKNIKLLIKAYTENMVGTVKRYYTKVSPGTLIDDNDELQDKRNIAFDIMFAQANQYYNDPYIESCYLRKNSAAPQYPGRYYWHVVNVYWPWSGVTATMPSYPFMFAGISR
jgi:hypothetical protein